VKLVIDDQDLDDLINATELAGKAVGDTLRCTFSGDCLKDHGRLLDGEDRERYLELIAQQGRLSMLRARLIVAMKETKS
jgi:hypothetical protein